MTWISIIPPQQAEGELANAYQFVYAQYPPEYGVRVAPSPRRRHGRQHRGGPQPDPRGDAAPMSALARDDDAGPAAVAPPARDDRHRRVGTQRLLLLNGEPRRVPASGILDEELAAALRRDHTQADLSTADRAMLDYAVKLTQHAWTE